MLILFGGQNYYAKGGANDFICTSSHLGILTRLAANLQEEGYCHYEAIEWWHVFDTVQNKIVAQSEWQAHGND